MARQHAGRMRGGTMAAMGEREVRLGVPTMKGMSASRGAAVAKLDAAAAKARATKAEKMRETFIQPTSSQHEVRCYAPAKRRGIGSLWTAADRRGLFEFYLESLLMQERPVTDVTTITRTNDW